MSVRHLAPVIFIFACTVVAWFVLGRAIEMRSHQAARKLGPELRGNWGPELSQSHPSIHYTAPTAARARRSFAPESSRVTVDLDYDPKRKGLLRYRTYVIDFAAEYQVRNPAPIAQTVFFEFELPAKEIRYDRFQLAVGENRTERAPEDGRIREAVRLEAGQAIPVSVAYRTNGHARWTYNFEGTPRVRDFSLAMSTDFTDYNIPPGSVSATARESTADGMGFTWEYSDVINAQVIGMEMPSILNPGPVASRMAFFAPVSLLFFFTVILIVSAVRKIVLHPMHYFFLAAGCFAFQLLFAYLVDLVPPVTAFAIAAAVSLLLVTGYLWRAYGKGLAKVSATAQFAYMVLFSASFFFDGLTGITITVGAIVTLAILMGMTARTDWHALFRRATRSEGAETARAS